MNYIEQKLNNLSSKIWDKVFERKDMGYFKQAQLEQEKNAAGEQAFYEEMIAENNNAVKFAVKERQQMDWLFDHITKGGKK